MKIFLGALALALVLFAGTGPRDDEAAAVEVAAPAETGQLDTLPAVPPAVPLEISETTPPPGWVHPDYQPPDVVALQLLGEAWDATKWGLVGVLVALGILAALVIAAERSRYQ